jgi:hypothetical protein
MLTGAVLLVGILLVASTFGPVAGAGQVAASTPEAPTDLACEDLVDQVTDYLDETLSPDGRARVEDHLAGCDGCTEYVRQIRLTVQALSELDPRAPDSETRPQPR